MHNLGEIVCLSAFLLPRVTQALSFSSFPSSLNGIWSRSLNARQSDDDFLNVDDQRWMQKLAAIGDSYSAGIGSGSRIDFVCSRYDASYPYLLSKDVRMNPDVQFDFRACSGAESPAITDQANALQGDQDAILISSGGNDVGLSFILNNCIFGWIPFDSKMCDQTMAITQGKIDNLLPGNLDTLLNAAKGKLSANGRIYVTGYAKFFNADTDPCDNVRWNVWGLAPSTTKQPLTKERRAKFNDLVDQVNAKLKAAVDKLGGQAVFVNYDPMFEALEGRYCEEGVNEADINRLDTLFFERGAPNTLKHRLRQTIDDQDTVANDTFEGLIANWVEDTLEDHPDWISDLQDSEFEELSNGVPVPLNNGVRLGLPSSGEGGHGNSSTGNLTSIHPVNNLAIPGPTWFLPDTMKRVFHPRAQGHNIIAGYVMSAMAIERAKMLNVYDGDTTSSDEVERVEYCQPPAPPPSSPLACFDSSSPDLPSKIIAWTGADGIVDPDNLLYRMREVICSNDCGVPSQVGWQHGAVWAEGGQRDAECEISIGIEGGIEAYMIRDRGIELGTIQQQHCYDKTEKIITQCVNNQAKEGWQNSNDPTPAFYQAGFRALNTGRHPAIPESNVLKKSLEGFQSICGAGDGPCQGNGCEGVWSICQAGKYKGCYCGYDSRASQLAPPDHRLSCHTDCCNTQNEWWTVDWCAANCGGQAEEYCS